MKVGLALHFVRRGKITGIERYGLAVAEGVARAMAPGMSYDVLASRTAAEMLPEATHTRARVTRLPGDWRLAGEQLVLPAWARAYALDLLHVPAFGGAVVKDRPFVLNVHDTVFWDTPASLSTLGRHYYKPLVERAIRHRALRATFYLSAQARDAVLKYFPHLAPTAHVTYCATPLPRGRGARRWRDRIDGPLRVLTVGTIEPRKNLPAMARAVERLCAIAGRPVRWQLVGRRGWATPEDDAALRIPQAEYLGGVDDARLVCLHAEADVYLSLSRLEGFNIPLLEAMGQGTPPVVSALPVHREVGGDGATLVDAEDADGVARAMHRLLVDEAAWDEASARAWERSAAFTVDAVARRVLEGYDEVA